MFIKKPKHRTFEYQPRHYKPEQDPEERRKRKLGFKSSRTKVSSKKSPFVFIVMLIIIVYLLLKYQGLL